MRRDRSTRWRAAAVLAVAMLSVGAFAASSTSAAKPFSKRKALKLFYPKSEADARFINVGEKAADADQLDGKDSAAFLQASDAFTKTEADNRFVRLVIVDQGSQSATNVTTGSAVTNTVSMTVPTSGILLISGSANIDNQTGVAGTFNLEWRLDGGSFVDGADATLNTNASPAEAQQLAFTDAVSVGPGTRTIDMQTNAGVATYDYRLANLSVMFVPGGSIT